MSNQNNKKELAEQLKRRLNDPTYTTVPEMPILDDYYVPLWAFVRQGKNKSFINVDANDFIMDWADQRKDKGFIYYRDLEPNDWEEIVKLIQQKKEEKEQNYLARKKEIEAKMDSYPGLYYRYSKKLSFSYFYYPDKQGKYFGIMGKENGRTFWLNINANHPVLNNFAWQENGYYLIETDKSIERNDQFGRPWSDRGEENENNFHKWVEVDDQITITPYEEKGKKGDNHNNNTTSSKGKISRLVTLVNFIQPPNEGKDRGNWDYFYYVFAAENGERFEINALNPAIGFEAKNKKEAVFLRAGYKGIRYWYKISWKAVEPDKRKFEKGDFVEIEKWENEPALNPINFLIQYFQEHNIKKIELVNGELVITHNNNNNEIVSKSQLINNSEYRAVNNSLQKINKNELTFQELVSGSSNPTNNSPSENKYLWLVGGFALGVGIFGVLLLALLRKKKKTN